MKNKYFLSALLLSTLLGNAQETELKTDSLKEVVVTSSRIDLPFKENSRTIQIVTAEDIKKIERRVKSNKKKLAKNSCFKTE